MGHWSPPLVQYCPTLRELPACPGQGVQDPAGWGQVRPASSSLLLPPLLELLDEEPAVEPTVELPLLEPPLLELPLLEELEAAPLPLEPLLPLLVPPEPLLQAASARRASAADLFTRRRSSRTMGHRL